MQRNAPSPCRESECCDDDRDPPKGNHETSPLWGPEEIPTEGEVSWEDQSQDACSLCLAYDDELLSLSWNWLCDLS